MTRLVVLVVSIDTEEDNWCPSRAGVTVENIRELERLQGVLDGLGARATYFATYQVAKQPWAAAILRDIRAQGRAEVGAHLHPWNTPPLEEAFIPTNTMALHLPQSLQVAKIATLTQALTDSIGERPPSFRTARWGFGQSTAAALLQSGYRIDSSVTPFRSWAQYDGGPSHVGAPLHVYRLDGRGDVRVPVHDGALVEVPVTAGYSRGWPATWGCLHAILDRPTVRWLRLAGMASRLHLVRHIGLCPESETVEDMLRLSLHLIEQGVRYLHLSWHSPSMRPALTPFVATAADVERLYRALQTYVERLTARVTVRFATVSEAATMLAPPLTMGQS